MNSGWIVKVTVIEKYRGEDDPLLWHFASLQPNKAIAIRHARALCPEAVRVEAIAPISS